MYFPNHDDIVVFDLDGTLALNDHRQHFLLPKDGTSKDWGAFFEACDKDEPNWSVIRLMHTVSIWTSVEIWSGRSDAVRGKTEAWLRKHGVKIVPLRMRAADDYRSDVDLKRAWLHESKRKPFMVFDDRSCVVDMWRQEGITCAQVAIGDF